MRRGAGTVGFAPETRSAARRRVPEDPPSSQRASVSERCWLGGRDSNPDNLLQRQMSYRWTTSQYQSSAPSVAEFPIIAAPLAGRQSAPVNVVLGRAYRIESLPPLPWASEPLWSSDSGPDVSPPCCLRRWLAIPPFRPASRASSLVHSCAVPFWCAALPPLLAISRCLFRSIEANPRSSFATVTTLLAYTKFVVRANTRAATDVPRNCCKSQQ